MKTILASTKLILAHLIQFLSKWRRPLLTLIAIHLSGCAYVRPIATIKHADGSGETKITYVVAGGIVRPGVIAVFAEVKGSNSPVILMNASGPPIAPSITGAAGNVASAATLSGLWPEHKENVSTTTVIQDEPRAGPIPPPNPIVHPPNGRPPSNRPANNPPSH